MKCDVSVITFNPNVDPGHSAMEVLNGFDVCTKENQGFMLEKQEPVEHLEFIWTPSSIIGDS